METGERFRDGGQLDVAIQVVGVVRAEIGVPWDTLALGDDGATAAFSLGPEELEGVRIRRRDLLVEYVAHLVVQRERRIQGRRSALARAAEHVAVMRARTAIVAEHVARVHAFGR